MSFRCGGVAELIVSENTAAQTHPGALEYHIALIVDDVGACGDIHLEGVGGNGGEGIVQSVDAFENNDVTLLGVEKSAAVPLLALLFEEVAGYFNGLTAADGIKMPGQ